MWLILLLSVPLVLSSKEPINIGPFKVDVGRTDEELFQKFSQHFNRSYSLDETARRSTIFSKNLLEIRKNPINYGITQFADWTPQEFQSKMLTLKPPVKKTSPTTLGNPVFDFFKWILTLFFPTTNQCRKNTCPVMKEGFDKDNIFHEQSKDLTPIFNQGKCGSCYAFAYRTALTDTWALYYKKKMDLISIQQIIDCSSAQGNQGCNGGLMSSVHKYIQDEGGINLEKDYRAYEAQKNECKPQKDKYVLKKIGSYTEIDCDENKFKEIIDKKMTIVLALDASTWQHYTGNIVRAKDCCMKQLNHAVALAGYGVENGTSYWLIKNSWATSWGDMGYIKVEAGQNCFGMCYMGGIITKGEDDNEDEPLEEEIQEPDLPNPPVEEIEQNNI